MTIHRRIPLATGLASSSRPSRAPSACSSPARPGGAGASPGEFSDFMLRERAEMGAMVRAANVRLD